MNQRIVFWRHGPNVISALRIIGAQVLDISGNTFSGSGRGGYSIRLDEAPWEKITVRGNTFHDSGKILSNRAL